MYIPTTVMPILFTILHVNGSLYQETKKFGDAEGKAFSDLRMGIILTGKLSETLFLLTTKVSPTIQSFRKKAKTIFYTRKIAN